MDEDDEVDPAERESALSSVAMANAVPDVAVCARVQVPPTADGALSGLRFAVKDVFAVRGHQNACGSPDWLRTHGPPAQHAPAVASLLEAGAELVAMTQMDEMAFSLAGQNAHYGAPPNPAAPGHTAGGSSSGSASVVAGARVDFALGTDTGGSVRVPASYCGIFGMRPTHGVIHVEGVVPLAPSFDTVGWFARDSKVLREVGEVLLPEPAGGVTSPGELVLLEDLLERLAGPLRSDVEREAQSLAGQLGLSCRVVRAGIGDPTAWADAFTALQGAEVFEEHGAWIRATSPRFGPGVAERMARAAELHGDVSRQASAAALRRALREALTDLLPVGTLLALPSAPGPAPSLQSPGAAGRLQALEVTSLASLTGIPQVSLPAMRVGELPFGLSLAAAAGQDHLLLRVALRWSCP